MHLFCESVQIQLQAVAIIHAHQHPSGLHIKHGSLHTNQLFRIARDCSVRAMIFRVLSELHYCLTVPCAFKAWLMRASWVLDSLHLFHGG